MSIVLILSQQIMALQYDAVLILVGTMVRKSNGSKLIAIKLVRIYCERIGGRRLGNIYGELNQYVEM